MASNPTERLNYENYITQGHKHLAQGNKSCGKRKGSHSDVLDQVELNLLQFKIYLEYGIQSYREIELRKIYYSGA
jgi:hypothetical protein